MLFPRYPFKLCIIGVRNRRMITGMAKQDGSQVEEL